MSNVSKQAISELRTRTQQPLMACKAALEESGGEVEKALELLRDRGAEILEERDDKDSVNGRVEAYVHHTGKTAGIVEVGCETDFLANSDDFRQFCKDLAMHVCASKPSYIDENAAGMDGWQSGPVEDNEILLKQPFVKDATKTIGDLLNELASKSGERITIRRISVWTI